MPKRMALHIGAYAACIMMSPWPLGAAHANFHGFRTCCAGPAQPRMGQEGKYQGQVLVLKGLSYLILNAGFITARWLGAICSI